MKYVIVIFFVWHVHPFQVFLCCETKFGFNIFKINKTKVFLILIVRIILSGFMFGSFSTIMYSLAGGIVSFCFMYMAKRIGLFSPLGVSITGAVFHNLGQLGVACLVLNSFAPLVYLPYLILLGAVTGTFIGMIGKIIEKANKR